MYKVSWKKDVAQPAKGGENADDQSSPLSCNPTVWLCSKQGIQVICISTGT